jgi:hypothetical protein
VHRRGGGPRGQLHRGVVAQQFLDVRRGKVRVGAQRGGGLGVTQQHDEAVAEQVGGGLEARDQQHHQVGQ